MLQQTHHDEHDQFVHLSSRSGRLYAIRQATPADRSALADIYLTCRRNTFSWVEPSHYHRSDFIEDTDGEHVLVCEAGGGIVGFSSVLLRDSFLHHLFVDEAHQGHGAGVALLRAAMSAVPGPMRLKCAARNERAMRFYGMLGGVIESTSEHEPEGLYRTLRLPNPLPPAAV